jgi:hypothetical protein
VQGDSRQFPGPAIGLGPHLLHPDSGDAEGSIEAQLQLAGEMPLIEYGRPGSDLFAPRPWLNPLAA